MRRLRIVQLGCGRWGRRVLAAIQRNAAMHLVAVVDTDPSARAYAASQATEALVTTEAEAAYRLADAAIVVTPPSEHAANAHQIIDAGLHVLVEKPLTNSSSTAAKLVAHAAQKQRIAAVGNLLRFHPAVQQVVQAASGQSPLKIQTRRFSQSGRPNPLWTLAPHDLDTLLALDSSEVCNIKVTTRPWLELHLELVSGTQAEMQFSTSKTPERSLWVKSPNATYRADELASPADPLSEQLSHFAQCVRDGKQPRNDFQSGARVVQLLEKIDSVVQTNTAHNQ